MKRWLKNFFRREPEEIKKDRQVDDLPEVKFDGRMVVFVVHQSPDTDAYVCILLMILKLLPAGYPYRVELVRAGERLSPDEYCGNIVFHLDTGLRYKPPFDFDQHALRAKERTASAKLVADYWRWNNDPGVRALVKLAVDTDNIREMKPDSIHNMISGYQFNPDFQDENGEPEWGNIVTQALFALRAMYDMTNYLVRSRVRFRRFCEKNPNEGLAKVEPSGVTIATVPRKPSCRAEAWKQGADVVVWTYVPDRNRPDLFWVGIGVNRKSDVSLRPVVAALRAAEAKKRGIKIPPKVKLGAIGKVEQVSTWFAYSADGERFPLILAGSRAHPLETEDEYTKLTWDEIKEVVFTTLSNERFLRKKKVKHLPAPKMKSDEIGVTDAEAESAELPKRKQEASGETTQVTAAA